MADETQTVEQQPKRIRVFGPDNKYYSFPPGTTKDKIGSFFKEKGITSPESKPVTTAPKETKLQIVGQSKDTIQSLRKDVMERSFGAPSAKAPEETSYFGRGIERSFGVDPQRMIEAFKRGGAKEQQHELGGQLIDNLKKFGHSVLKDPFNLAQIVEAPASQIEVGGGKIYKGLTETTPGTDEYKELVYGGAGELFGAIGQILGGAEGVEKLRAHAPVVDGAIKASADIATKTGADTAEATTTAHKLSTGVPSKILRRRAFEDHYIHAKGLDVAKKIDKAVKAVDEEVKTHASGIAKEIDTKIPTGVIDASAEADSIVKEFKDVVKTPEKVHPSLIQMVKDARATAPKQWSWEKTRQFRSSVGRAIGKVEGPQKVVLTRVYKDLTNKLGGTAKQYGLEKSWMHYNELAMKIDKQYADIIDDVRDSKSGEAVAKKLSKDTGLTAELINNLQRYGLDGLDTSKFIKDSQRILKQRGAWNKTLFRLAYGSPVGATAMIGMRLAGAPWLAGLGTGAAIGLMSSYLVNLARVMKLDPSIIEQMMKQRELPGKMKFEGGTFPGGEAPAPEQTLSTPPTPKATPQLPTPKTEGPKERWYTDKRSIPGEPRAYLDVPGEDLDKAKAAIVEHESPKGTRFEAVDSEGKSLGTFDTMDQAKAAAEGKYKKAEPGVGGKGKLAEQAKARERVAKTRATAKRTRETQTAEAQARAQATHMDVSQLQIPEMEEYLRAKKPAELSNLQRLRKTKGITDEMYIEGLKYYILEGLEE
jgi:hypothetical protein